MPQYMSIIRTLVGITAFIALSATVQNYLSSANMKKAYGLSPLQASFLMSRVMCMFTSLSCAVRVSLVYDIKNKVLYFLTMFTYLDVLAHYIAEYSFFKTAAVCKENAVAVVIAVVMLVLMTIGHLFFSEDKPGADQQEESKKKL